jgi:hypothetical protein
MGVYVVSFARSGDAAKTVGAINCPAAVRRAFIYEINFGCAGVPAENALLWRFQRVTTLGVSTPVTPAKKNPADGVAAYTAGENHTTEPTYTAGELVITDIPLHQKTTFRWVAAQESAKIVIPGTQNHGVGILTPITVALSLRAGFEIEE